MLSRTRSWLLAHRPQAWLNQRGRDAEQIVPQERMTRMYVSLKRRLSDKIEDVLDEACVTGDLQTAEELLAVLELMHVRPPRLIGRERRSAGDRLIRFRTEVETLRERRAVRRRGLDASHASQARG